MKEAYYFSHDSNARNDVKILRLRRQLGAEGYAIYFMIVELLREQQNYMLPLASIPDIAYDLDVSEEKVKTVIFNYELFCVSEDSLFFSDRLLRSMDQYKTLRTKLSEAGKRGAEARLKLGSSHPQALKEKKGNEKKENETGNLPFASEGFASAWADWENHRREIRKKLTPSTASKQLKKLATYSESVAIAMINQSIEHGWNGLFELAGQQKQLTLPGMNKSVSLQNGEVNEW